MVLLYVIDIESFRQVSNAPFHPKLPYCLTELMYVILTILDLVFGATER